MHDQDDDVIEVGVTEELPTKQKTASAKPRVAKKPSEKNSESDVAKSSDLILGIDKKSFFIASIGGVSLVSAAVAVVFFMMNGQNQNSSQAVAYVQQAQQQNYQQPVQQQPVVDYRVTQQQVAQQTATAYNEVNNQSMQQGALANQVQELKSSVSSDDVKAQIAEVLEKLTFLSEMQSKTYLEVTGLKDRLAKNEKAVEDVVENSKTLVARIEQLEQKVAQLSRASTVQNRVGRNNEVEDVATKKEVNETSPSLSGWSIMGMSDERVVLKSPKGNSHIVGVGETVAGRFTVKTIDVQNNMILTTRGEKLYGR